MAVPHQAQIRDKNFHNFDKAGLALKYTKKGIESFIDDETREFHTSLLKQLGQQPPQNCGQCTIDNLLPHKSSACPGQSNTCICSKHVDNRRECPNNICGKLFTAILSAHRFKRPAWKNSQMSQWVTDHWELGKNYLPNSRVYIKTTSARDTDLNALLSIGINLVNITNRHNFTRTNIDGSPDDFYQCRSARNEISHCASPSLTDDQLSDYLTIMRGTLQCTAALRSDPSAQQSLINLSQLEISAFVITDDEISNAGYKEEKNMDELPSEIQELDKDTIELYRKALRDGSERVYDIRLKLVGHQNVGKTSLTKKLLKKTVCLDERESTDGIDVHIGHCRISLETGEWICSDEDHSLDSIKERFSKGLRSYAKSEDQPSMELGNDEGTDDKAGDTQNKETGIPGAAAQNKEIGIPGAAAQNKETGIPGAAAQNKEFDILKGYFEKNQGGTTHQQETENHAEVSIWDFAGQQVFYNTHQIFLSPRSIYLLVTNIDEDLNVDIPIDPAGCKSTKTRKVSDFLEFWLNSIHFFCNDSGNATDPPVILVATHADSLGKDKKEAEQETNKHFLKIRRLFKSKKIGGHIVDDADIAVNNLMDDPNIDTLMKTIFQEAQKQHHWGEQRPIRWIALEEGLFEEKHKNGKKIISGSELEDMNRKLLVPLSEPEELKLFLRFQNDIGNFLHIDEEELKDHVVLDPQWLVDAFKRLVKTGQQETEKKMGMLKLWEDFTKTGKLSAKLLEFLLSGDFEESSEIIISFFERLGIIAKPIADVDYFFAPYYLEEPPESVFPIVNDRTTNRFCLTTNNRFLPEIIFNRLLAACISSYKIFKNQIFWCCGVFYYDQAHSFTVFYTNNMIKILVKWLNPEKIGPKIGVCEDIRSFMVHHLMRLCRLNDEKKIRMYIDCPRVEVRSQEGLRKVSLLQTEIEGVNCKKCPDHFIKSKEALKHWFPQEKTEQNMDALELTEKQLNQISQRVGEKWKSLAIELDLTQEQIAHIVEDNISTEYRIFCVLKEWKRAKGRGATCKQLTDALKRINMNAEYVLKPILEA